MNGITVQLSPRASLFYCENYLEKLHADELLSYCQKEIPWVQSQILMFGKRVPIPRLNAWYGIYPYRYSGTNFAATTLPAPLEALQQQIIQDSSLTFNSVLANLYRHGNDGMGWHSDDEKSLGELPQIASVSLGGARRFIVRRKENKREKKELQLNHGSLLLMLGDCQREWQHSLPKTRKTTQARVNLTFRESLQPD